MSDKYQMFRNFMYNELGVTKDDIREWTKETVKEVAEQYIENNFSQYRLEQYMNSIINRSSKQLEWTNIGWKDALEKFVVAQLEKNISAAIKQAVTEASDK
jgi:small-conductance mechanosensitive channel